MESAKEEEKTSLMNALEDEEERRTLSPDQLRSFTEHEEFMQSVEKSRNQPKAKDVSIQKQIMSNKSLAMPLIHKSQSQELNEGLP